MNNEAIEAVIKLVEYTRNGLVQWEVLEDPAPLRSGGRHPVYSAIHRGNRLRIYTFAEPPRAYRLGRDLAALEILDDRGLPIWSFPDHVESATRGLFDTIEYRKNRTNRIPERLRELAAPPV